MKLRIKPSEDIIVVDAATTGRLTETARLALDTGASYVMIPWRIAKALDLKAEFSRDEIYMTTASGSVLAPIVKVKSITVLGKTAHNVKVVVHDLPEGANVDGLLGLSFLKNFEININFKKGYLEIK